MADPTADGPAAPAETGPEREARLAHERALIGEAREDVRAGRVIHDEDVDAWLDLLVRGEPLSRPIASSVRRPP